MGTTARFDHLVARDWAGWLLTLVPVALVFGSAAADVVCVAFDIALLVVAYSDQRRPWLPGYWERALLLLWAYTVIRAVWAEHALHSLASALAWGRFALLAIGAAWILRERVWRDRLLLSTIIAVAFLAADSALQAIVGFDVIGRPLYEGRLTATFTRPRVGVTIAWLFLPATLGLFASGWRAAALALAALCLTAILLSGDRVAFLFAVSCCAFAVLTIRLDRRIALALIGSMAVFVAALLFVRPDVYERQVHSTVTAIEAFGSTHYGVIWRRAVIIASQNPVFGLGTDEYRDACANPRFGAIESSNNNLPACALHPHNIYLEWFVDGGVLALGGFVAVLALLAARLGAVARAIPANPVLAGLVITLALRFFPLSSSTGLGRAWFAVPLWLCVGWAVAWADVERHDALSQSAPGR